MQSANNPASIYAKLEEACRKLPDAASLSRVLTVHHDDIVQIGKSDDAFSLRIKQEFGKTITDFLYSVAQQWSDKLQGDQSGDDMNNRPQEYREYCCGAIKIYDCARVFMAREDPRYIESVIQSGWLYLKIIACYKNQEQYNAMLAVCDQAKQVLSAFMDDPEVCEIRALILLRHAKSLLDFMEFNKKLHTHESCRKVAVILSEVADYFEPQLALSQSDGDADFCRRNLIAACSFSILHLHYLYILNKDEEYVSKAAGCLEEARHYSDQIKTVTPNDLKDIADAAEYFHALQKACISAAWSSEAVSMALPAAASSASSNPAPGSQAKHHSHTRRVYDFLRKEDKVQDERLQRVVYLLPVLVEMMDNDALKGSYPELFSLSFNSLLIGIVTALRSYSASISSVYMPLTELLHSLSQISCVPDAKYYKAVKDFVELFADLPLQVKSIGTNARLRDLFVTSLAAITAAIPVDDDPQVLLQKLGEYLRQIALLNEFVKNPSIKDDRATLNVSEHAENGLCMAIKLAGELLSQLPDDKVAQLQRDFARLNLPDYLTEFRVLSNEADTSSILRAIEEGSSLPDRLLRDKAQLDSLAAEWIRLAKNQDHEAIAAVDSMQTVKL